MKLRTTLPQEAVDFIRKNYKTMSQTEMARSLGCNSDKVNRVLKALDLLSPKRPWTAEEDFALLAAKDKSIEELAAQLERTTYAIARRRQQLSRGIAPAKVKRNIRKASERVALKPQDLNGVQRRMIRENRHIPVDRLAFMLNCTPESAKQLIQTI